MILVYILAFCRIAIGAIFVVSLAGKARDLRTFKRTITRFRLLPPQYSAALAWAVLAAELLIVLSMLLGNGWLWIGFLCAVAVLGAFSLALWSVIARQISTSCNCFGAREQAVSIADLWRNGGFIVCVLGGVAALAAGSPNSLNVTWLEWALIGSAALAFVGVSLHAGDIHWLLREEIMRKKEVSRGSASGR